ncbi:MAG TPA: NlpC/P60 family protein [Gemmatimonadaceae bacterium]|nr:NlpC/P60 family protein [Gemmatimonadaceae bacterium]
MRLIRARTPLAPILKEPRAPATQESQLLFGHAAEVVTAEGAWLRVRGADAYEGWVHKGYVEPAENADSSDRTIPWGWETLGEVSLGCVMRDEHGATVDLPLGAIVREGKCIGGRSADLVKRRELFPTDADAIVASATGLFQGTYYQWGGITPWGADCSGMVQTVFALHGVRLLRDAWQQATQGVTVEGGMEALMPADLLFFSDREDGHITHVAMAVSSKRLVHLAIGRGGYCIESLERPDEYVGPLITRFRFARRIL